MAHDQLSRGMGGRKDEEGLGQFLWVVHVGTCSIDVSYIPRDSRDVNRSIKSPSSSPKLDEQKGGLTTDRKERLAVVLKLQSFLAKMGQPLWLQTDVPDPGPAESKPHQVTHSTDL